MRFSQQRKLSVVREVLGDSIVAHSHGTPEAADAELAALQRLQVRVPNLKSEIRQARDRRSRKRDHQLVIGVIKGERKRSDPGACTRVCGILQHHQRQESSK